jgi:hypothetical protein
MMVGKEIDEIKRIGKLRKQNEDGVKSKKVKDGIGNVRGGCGILMGITECRSRWKKLEVAWRRARHLE